MKKAVSGEYKKYLIFTYENVMRKPITGYNLLMISDENKECTFLLRFVMEMEPGMLSKYSTTQLYPALWNLNQ